MDSIANQALVYVLHVRQLPVMCFALAMAGGIAAGY
jgi:hypothetical protein